MSGSIKQYLDLFTTQRDVIEAHSAPVIDRLRQKAFNTLQGMRLPEKGDEGFEKTSIEAMFAPDFGLNISRLDIPVNIAASFRCDVPNVSTLLGIVANDKFIATDTLLKNLPEGVIVMSLDEAARKYPETVGRHLGSVAPTDNAAVALNTMLVQDGVMIKIPRGTKVERPIQIVNIFNSPTPLMALRRILIIAEENSSAHILLCDHSQGEPTNPYLSSQVIEVICGRDSEIQLYDIEESSQATSRYNQVFVRQHEGSSFLANATTLLNGTTRNDFVIGIDGQHCSTGLYGMAIGSGSQHIDNSSSVIHNAGRSTSNQLFKYVLDDKASGAFEGGIEVTPGAVLTEAYQSNNNILASKDARMHTKPQLLIYNDDVKCSHGATTGQLDAAAMFYMQTRGIAAGDARMMLMQAFMVDVISTVRVEGVRDRLRHLVEKRFSGRLASCSSCHSSCR